MHELSRGQSNLLWLLTIFTAVPASLMGIFGLSHGAMMFFGRLLLLWLPLPLVCAGFGIWLVIRRSKLTKENAARELPLCIGLWVASAIAIAIFAYDEIVAL